MKDTDIERIKYALLTILDNQIVLLDGMRHAEGMFNRGTGFWSSIHSRINDAKKGLNA